MSEPKKVELSKQQVFENMLFSLAAIGNIISALYWYVGLCAAQHKAGKRIGLPVTVQLFGVRPEDGTDLLKAYNMRYAFLGMQWAVIDNQIGLLYTLWVSQAAFDYADNILSQYEGNTFAIMSRSGTKRGQTLRRPYTQRQTARPKAGDNRTGKTGKAYRY